MYIGNMGHWISWWCKVDSTKTAVIFQGRHVSYGQLNENINRLANALKDRYGIKKGDRVGCLLLNCVEYFEIVFACSKIGARFVPFNIRLTGREIEYIVKDSAPRVFILEKHFETVLESVKGNLQIENYLRIDNGEYEQLLSESNPSEPDNQAIWADDFAILYTSGTTGFPKGAVLMQQNILTCSHNMMTTFGYSHRDTFLLQLPLCFTGALIPLSMPLFHGGGTIYLEKEFAPARTLEIIAQERITVGSGVPTMWKMVSDLPEFNESDFSSLRFIMSGGAPVPTSLIKTYRAKGVKFTGGYGLTEGGGFNLYVPLNLSEEKSGAYIPLLWNEVKVVNESGEQVSPGEVGEIAIRGSVVMREYWNQPEITAETIRDGWLHTGDLATLDAEGYYNIVDRAKDMIVSGGLNVYPAEVENIIYSNPKVLQTAVIGLPHDVWGEMVVALVISKQGVILEEQELIRFCRENLADYKSPKAVIFVDQIPANASGKVLKRVLREQYAGHFTKGSV